ncbi:MAG: AsmA family protein, partial [Alphaproteobacteria bacterium]
MAPSLVDWNRYKPEIAAAAAALTGRDVVIEGDVGFEFFPAPVLRVDDVRVSNPAGFGGGEIARAGAVHLRVSLPALMAGRIEVGTVTVVRPLLTMEILPDGRRNWLPASATPGRAVGKGAAGVFAFPSVGLDLSVESAFVIFRDDRSGYVRTLERLDIAVSGAAPAGPYRAVGRFEFRGRPIAFDGSFGPFGEGGKAPVKIALWRREIAARIRFTGDIDMKLADPVLTGTVRGGGEDFLAFAAVVAGFDQARAPDILGADFDFEADIQVNGVTAAFDKLSMKLGEFRAAGAGAVQLARPAVAELALAVEAVNLDRLLRGRASAARTSISGLPRSSAGVDEIIEDVLSELGPDKVSLHLTLGALIHNGGIARDLRLDADLGAGEMLINRFFVRLPGAAELSVTGIVGLEDGEPHFEGIADATGSNLRGTLDWLGMDSARVPPDRLRKFAVTSRIAATPDIVRFEGV